MVGAGVPVGLDAFADLVFRAPGDQGVDEAVAGLELPPVVLGEAELEQAVLVVRRAQIDVEVGAADLAGRFGVRRSG